MDYLIEVRCWCLGFDEAEELAAKIADVCAERGLALQHGGDEEEIRAMVSLKPQVGRLDASGDKAGSVISRAAQGAQLLLVPSQSGMLIDRPRSGM